MKTAVTLIHKGAMPIAVHAVESFTRLHGSKYRLEIHSDGSLELDDLRTLEEAAAPERPTFIFPSDRDSKLAALLKDYPKTAELISRGAYFTKLQLPIVIEKPYFFFDSDIVWLRPVGNLTPPDGGNAFSTETWSWYYGVCRDSKWIAANTPRRVNSGFYHLGDEFPFARMEHMLEQGMFNPEIPYNTDQEIMAYLFPNMVHYHINDMKRSRVGAVYDLSALNCAALHFPGGMWRAHMDQIERLRTAPVSSPITIRFTPSVSLDRLELWRMRSFMSLSKSRLLKPPLELYRKIRKAIR